MKKVLLLLIALVVLTGCGEGYSEVADDVDEVPVEVGRNTETKKEVEKGCTIKEAKYQWDVLDTLVREMPNEAYREYTEGIVRLYVLNDADSGIEGDFTVGIDCMTALGPQRENQTVRIAPGKSRDFDIRCRVDHVAGVLSMSDPIFEAVPSVEVCD